MPDTAHPIPTLCDRDAIAAAERLIRPYIRRTPILAVAPGDFGIEAGSLLLKLEMLQHTGSFKVRGALANLLMRPIPPAGVVAASGGNHGVAVAYAANRLGRAGDHLRAQRRRPGESGADPLARRYPRDRRDRYDDALTASQAFVAERGGLPVHAFDQRETLLGQGTIGLELEADAPAFDTLLVAVGGGGLIGGIAAWFDGRVRIIGVEPERAPTLFQALAAGGPVDAEAGGIAADSLAPRRTGDLVFPIVRDRVERVALVPDEAIRAAQEALWATCRVVAEPGGAAALAALLSGRYRPAPGERVAVLVCGANTDALPLPQDPAVRA
ncbi:MAG: serine/threonine dehydratase [Acetobacteraceae bacterium]